MSNHQASGDDASNANARDSALAAISDQAVEPSTRVGYQSNGALLIIGSSDSASTSAVRAWLADHPTTPLRPLLLTLDAGATTASDPSLPIIMAGEDRKLHLSGHLGAFQAQLLRDQAAPIEVAASAGLECFDLVLDLSPVPHLDAPMAPFGYRAISADPEQVDGALEALSEQIGEFEKPKYFDYQVDLCAHSRSGLPGCSRCLSACPAGAISSLIDQVQIDPYLCQGGGSCATACPSGAIIYAYPRPADLSNRLRRLLRHYREAGGESPVLLFHDSEAGAKFLSERSAPLPGQVLTIELEEIGSTGLDTWLNALAFGAARVLLLLTQVPDRVRDELNHQVTIGQALLTALGYPAASALRGIGADPNELDTALAAAAMPIIQPAGFAGSNDKRNAMLFAIDWLVKQAAERRTDPTRQPGPAALPLGAPFGEVQVDRDACTLCMGCASVCPAAALTAGGDTPRLDFIEANCLQCGLCHTACPEDAITLVPRIQFDREHRQTARALNEEAPFQCVGCGKPFATRSVIDKMRSALASHAMFQDPAALQRLEMCGDCRVRHLLIEQNQNQDQAPS